MIHLDKDIFGYLSIACNVGGTIPYCILVIRGKTKPHIFTWLIWATVMAIAAAARSAEDAGPGAWASWSGSAACFIITAFALFKGEKAITRSDVIALVAALVTIPLWLLTHNPLVAIIMVTIIDVIGYYPTMRKSYFRPHQETVFNYMIANTVHVLSLFATIEYSLATILYPATLFAANTILITLILWRRHVLRQNVEAAT